MQDTCQLTVVEGTIVCGYLEVQSHRLRVWAVIEDHVPLLRVLCAKTCSGLVHSDGPSHGRARGLSLV